MKPPLVIHHLHNGWFKVTLHSGQSRNYGSLATLLGFVSDYYAKRRKK